MSAIHHHSRTPVIVYVEDNRGDVELLEEAFRERNHKVSMKVFDKGDDALHYFEVRASSSDVPPPHCILLDDWIPVIMGSQLLRFLRTCAAFTDTPVYLFTPESRCKDLITDKLVSTESFLTKPGKWEELLALADLLMSSVTAKVEMKPASKLDSNPEVHAEGTLRRQDTTAQRHRVEQGPPNES